MHRGRTVSGDSLTAGGAVPLAYASERPSRRSLWKLVVAEHTKFGGGYFVQPEGLSRGREGPWKPERTTHWWTQAERHRDVVRAKPVED